MPTWRHAAPHLAPFGCRAASPAGVAAVDVSQPGHGGGVARGGNVAGGAAQRKVWRSSNRTTLGD